MQNNEEKATEQAQSKPTEEVKEDGFTDEEAKKDKKVDDEVTKLKAELADANVNVEKWKNEYYRAYADLDNLRKSLEKDHAEAMKYRSEGFLEELLPALDGFYLALGSVPNSEEAKNYRVGFQYIYNQIQSTLTNEGVKEVLPKVGDDFNPATMHAMEAIPSDGPEGKILKVNLKGFMLKDRLIRPAMVSVSAKKTEVKTKPAEEQTPVSDKNDEAHKA